MALAGIMLIKPGTATDLAGLALGALVYLSQRVLRGRPKEVPDAGPRP